MKLANALLARFGLAVKGTKTPDAFDLRLRRIEQREAKHKANRALFRNQRSLQAI